MLTQLTGVSLAGASVQLSEKGKRLAEAMAEARKTAARSRRCEASRRHARTVADSPRHCSQP